MSATNALENALLLLLFENANFANVGDATGIRGSSTAGNLFISLHTSDPGEGGDQTTNETAYTNYARVSVSRAAGSWVTSGNATSNEAEIAFPECGATGATITHFGIGSATSGAGILLFKGALGASRAISAGITPRFAVGELDVTAD